MKNLLITAFEPFGGEKINASAEVLKRLPDTISDWAITKLTLPVVFGEAAGPVIGLASDIKADAIISLGQAAGRTKVTPEYVAINFRDARIPDNAGKKPCRERISPEGPDAYFATLPVFDMASAINECGLPGEVSYSAGTYVCNELYYSLLRYYSGSGVGVAFIHLPLSAEQAADGQPCMELDDMVRAISSAVLEIPLQRLHT